MKFKKSISKTPIMNYFALIVAFSQKYDEEFGIGTIVSTMISYAVLFTICWTLLLIIWMLIGLPVGPGGPLRLYFVNQGG